MSAHPFAREPKRLIAQREAARHGVLDEAVVLTRAECEDIIQRALRASKADACRVSVNSSYDTNVRFADNQMSTSGITDDASVSITSFVGKRSATVLTNDLTARGLETAVAQSEALARLAPEDPESLPELGPQRYVEIPAWFDSTAQLSADDRARAALTALEVSRRANDLQVAGFIECNASARAIGNSAGLFAFHRGTRANYTLTVRTADGTGSSWSGADENDWSKIDFRAMATRTIERARASREPRAVEPGRYTVIFEPQASADFLGAIRGTLGARAADEGRSAMAKPGGGTKLGERILDSRISLVSDPADAQILNAPFDNDGLPLQRETWVENGILKQLSYDRFWAQKQGVRPTGGGGGFGGGGGGFKMLGGDSSIDAMIRGTERGVLVTRLWYLRAVDQRTLVYTGLTRDGTFLIENGRISRSIKNFRFNDSPLLMLNKVDAIGPTVRTDGGVFPAIKARDFAFTSLSDAV
ncbi:TldD/PmbA family protein [Pseudogemmatithrix spongiicola]|uniref:TldD/PmbA family protein n=1 Tax=Pseudogemmatithrix spongiicola TaxID=3062599 RepID=A0AA49K2H4_9BACT|nr:TldD/PmbA family protein [Gemmatimonadaceae bacterium 'strain 138']WKW16516.1 TldD/PmbA family protein [Gemmatimonadaceae bacterium 'strain 318']